MLVYPDAIPPKKKLTNERLSADTWIDGAMRLLIEKSADAVRVEVLAKELGVTKGSFYWHFKDRDDLLESVLRTWRERTTSGIIERVNSQTGDAQSRLHSLFALPNRSAAAVEGAALELAIRAWARRNAQARAAVDAVDEERLRYTASLCRELGYSEDEAQARAFVGYAYLIAESLMRNQGTDRAKKFRRRFVEVELLKIKN